MVDKISLEEQFRNCVLLCGEKVQAQSDYEAGFFSAADRDEKAKRADGAFRAMLKRIAEVEAGLEKTERLDAPPVTVAVPSVDQFAPSGNEAVTGVYVND